MKDKGYFYNIREYSSVLKTLKTRRINYFLKGMNGIAINITNQYVLEFYHISHMHICEWHS